ncbi:MAG: Spy/CpxP family protein refolding chaperone [Burkholderiales bacterium]
MKRSVFFALVIALALPAIDAGAQFSGGGGMGRGGMGGAGGGMRGQMGGRDNKPDASPVVRRDIVDETEDRLYTLEDALHLTPDQQPIWARYATSVSAAAKDVARDRDGGVLREKVPVLVRLDRIVEASRNRFTALEDMNAAAKALYEKLTPRQRDLCDPQLGTIAALLFEGASQPAIVPRAGR